MAGGSATFSLAVTGNPPPFGFELRKEFAGLTNEVSNERFHFFTLNNVQPSDAARYRIAIRNAASPVGTVTQWAYLTVLADNDRDGLPDAWEAARGFNTNDATDAVLDTDGDGQLNRAEYVAGTNPLDPQSYLRIESVLLAGEKRDRLELSFTALSNRTYVVELRDSATTSEWARLLEVLAHPTNRLVHVTNQIPTGANTRIYRLATPWTSPTGAGP